METKQLMKVKPEEKSYIHLFQAQHKISRKMLLLCFLLLSIICPILLIVILKFDLSTWILYCIDWVSDGIGTFPLYLALPYIQLSTNLPVFLFILYLYLIMHDLLHSGIAHFFSKYDKTTNIYSKQIIRSPKDKKLWHRIILPLFGVSTIVIGALAYFGTTIETAFIISMALVMAFALPNLYKSLSKTHKKANKYKVASYAVTAFFFPLEIIVFIRLVLPIIFNICDSITLNFFYPLSESILNALVEKNPVLIFARYGMEGFELISGFISYTTLKSMSYTILVLMLIVMILYIIYPIYIRYMSYKSKITKRKALRTFVLYPIAYFVLSWLLQRYLGILINHQASIAEPNILISLCLLVFALYQSYLTN